MNKSNTEEEKKKKTYKAIVFDEKKQSYAIRVEIEAYNSTDAGRIMRQKYGRGRYINLHNEEDANKPR